MTTLYGCKKTQDREVFLIAKFDDDLVIQKSYFVGPKTCQCEGWQKRGQCKHLTIRTLFMMNGHTSDGHFLDFENRIWREYPKLVEEGSAVEHREYREKYDDLRIGDKGYQQKQSETKTLQFTYDEFNDTFKLPGGSPSPVSNPCERSDVVRASSKEPPKELLGLAQKIGDLSKTPPVPYQDGVGAEGVSLSSPAPAPGVERGPDTAPPGATLVVDGIKRRRGL